MDCYHFIFENFEAQYQIYLFGFSRGAATVRSLSAFIHLFGVLPKSRSDLIEKAFDIYRIKNEEDRESRATAFIEKHHTMWCKVKFLGVWDTVAALGLPIKWLSVEFARHALSIDDERKTFHPLIWEPLNNEQSEDRIKQVWFCGVHTDVGGGYEEDELSNIALKWMIYEAQDKDLILYKESKAYKALLDTEVKINEKVHDEQKGFPGNLFKRKERDWNKDIYGEPCIHESILKRTQNKDNSDSSKYSPWILNHDGKYNPTIELWQS